MSDPLFPSYLTAPWKLSYVTGLRAAECVFCSIRDGKPDIPSWEVFRDRQVMVLLNMYPYNPGHLLVAPLDHFEDYREVPSSLASHLQETVQRCMRMLQATHEPSGFNIGLNQGTAGGASVTHLHFHIVPRYGKSASELNFMDILGTRVLVETLDQTLEKLTPHVKAFLG